jgi:hypothetical protein
VITTITLKFNPETELERDSVFKKHLQTYAVEFQKLIDSQFLGPVNKVELRVLVEPELRQPRELVVEGTVVKSTRSKRGSKKDKVQALPQGVDAADQVGTPEKV